jgi:hypothetical protein
MGVLMSRIDYEAALRLVGDAGSGVAYDETVSTLAPAELENVFAKLAVETRTAAVLRLKG